MQFKIFHSALPDKNWIRILKRRKSKHWLAYYFFPVVNPQVCSLARELWYGIIIKAPSHPASEMLLPPPCMKGKQDFSSDIALEQADYISLVILMLVLSSTYQFSLPKSLKSLLSSSWLHTEVFLWLLYPSSHSIISLSQKMLLE